MTDEVRRGEGESIATMWARMVGDAENGDGVAIANRHGKDVAVMISIDQYNELLARADLLD